MDASSRGIYSLTLTLTPKAPTKAFNIRAFYRPPTGTKNYYYEGAYAAEPQLSSLRVPTNLRECILGVIRGDLEDEDDDTILKK